MIRRAQFKLLAAALALPALSCSGTPTGPLDTTWHLLPAHVEPFSYFPFRDGRPCWVYVPPGYAVSAARYPVLYVTDGETAFDGPGNLHIGRTCESLIRRHEIEPLIVVAIASGPSSQRFVDLTPWADGYAQPSGGGDYFIRAIRDTLKPEVDRRYRTLRDPANTAIAGVSLGGLMAAYAGYAYDGTFGKIAAFSPSYWWAYGAIFRLAESRGRPPLLTRFYQDTGTAEINRIDGMERIALKQGFVLGVDFMSVTAWGGTHSNGAWEHRYPDMLRFLFRPGD